jgi:hypothetical protein
VTAGADPDGLAPPTPAGTAAPPASGSLLLRDILAETERRVIRQALEQEKWNLTRAARALGISRRQLCEKIQQQGLGTAAPDRPPERGNALRAEAVRLAGPGPRTPARRTLGIFPPELA